MTGTSFLTEAGRLFLEADGYFSGEAFTFFAIQQKSLFFPAYPKDGRKNGVNSSKFLKSLNYKK
jgi:hypothetical protein